MNYKCAICDDSDADLDYIAALVSQWANDRKALVHIDVFTSAEAFLFHYDKEKDYDILLLDIEMKQMDGVTMAKTVRKTNETVQIVFITGYSEYIAEGYEVSALNYLVKPLQEKKLREVLDRATVKLQKNERFLTVCLSGETLRIPFYEIRYLEVMKNYVTIHGKRDYTVKKTLGEFEEQLDERFYRTGRSYLLNLTWIERVTKTAVILNDGTNILLPRGQYEPLNRAIIKHT